MKKPKRKPLIIVFVLSFLMLLYSCGSTSIFSRGPKSISVSARNSSIRVNDSVVLQVSYDPVDTWDKSLEWKSSDESVAVVTESGKVTGRSAGTATITAISANGQTGSITISVKQTKDSSSSETFQFLRDYMNGETNDDQEQKRDYVLNKRSHVFHYPDCHSVGQMNESNKKKVHDTRENVIDMGYRPCGNCNP